jgi:hypothetical protein
VSAGAASQARAAPPKLSDMDLAGTIAELLARPEALEDDDALVERLADAHGRPAVLGAILDALRDDARQAHWAGASIVLWGCVLDEWELPVDEVIALLLHRLQIDRTEEDNLVWSIICKLKRVSYLSSYDALDDPGVRTELRRLGR